MKIYNTLNKKIETFIPKDSKIVKLYTCGPTVYHYAHIGNLRTYIFEDVLEKGLELLGYKVDRVMNITDIGHLEGDSDTGEDKMEKEAKKENKTIREIADFYTQAFVEDCKSLNIRIPQKFIKASDNIPFTIEMISKIIDNGYAYVSNNNVYFDVYKFNNYYKLSGIRKEQKTGVRDTVEYDHFKKHQEDFALWFTDSKFKNQEMKWESPWGYGYPGWHIECSGLAIKYLGEYLDIHCGGVDNIFPHHTNEIAQSESFLGHKWCNYFIHGEHLRMKDAKMSKSLGNVITISRLKEMNIDPLSYRFMVLSSHYRKLLNFSIEELENYQNALFKIRQKCLNLNETSVDLEIMNKYVDEFQNAFANDINTSYMITLIHNVLKDTNINSGTKRSVLKKYDEILGLDLFKTTSISKELEEYILKQIELRNQYKNAKDYENADKIRNELLEKNIFIKDTREGTKYEIK